MNALVPWLPSQSVLLFLANVALVASAACLLGLLLLRWGRRTSLPFQHGLLVAVLGLVLVSPAVVAVSTHFGWGMVAVPVRSYENNQEPEEARGRENVPGPDQAGTTAVTADGFGMGTLVLGGALLAGAWACGTVVLGLRFVRALTMLFRWRRALPMTSDAGLREEAAAALASLGVRRTVSVCETRLAAAPLSLGWQRPAIVLPVGLARKLAPEQLRLVLRHEGAHILRRDHLVALLQSIAAVLFWWNPLLYVVSTRLARLREQLCDDVALRSPGEGRKLAEALLLVAEWSTVRRQDLIGAVGLLDDGPEELAERIERLLPATRPIVTRMSGPALAGVLAVVVCFGGLALALAPRAVSFSHVPVGSLDDELLGITRGYDDVPSTTAFSAQQWQMALPAGFQHTVTLTPVGAGRYRLEPRRLNSSGVYEVRGNRLVIIEPNDRRLLGFEWEHRGPGRLILIGQPPVTKTGSNYLGAQLNRL